MATRKPATATKPATDELLASVTLIQVKETPGTFVFSEIDSDGDVIEDFKQATVGKLYIRKSKLKNGSVPTKLQVDVRVVE